MNVIDPFPSDTTATPDDEVATWPVAELVDDAQPSGPTVVTIHLPNGVYTHIEASYEAQTPQSSRLLRANYLFVFLVFSGALFGCLWLARHGHHGWTAVVIMGAVVLLLTDAILMLRIGPKVDEKYRRSLPVHDDQTGLENENWLR